MYFSMIQEVKHEPRDNGFRLGFRSCSVLWLTGVTGDPGSLCSDIPAADINDNDDDADERRDEEEAVC